MTNYFATIHIDNGYVLRSETFKLRYPQQIFMLRGNHETRAVNRVYGFFEECTKRFPERGEGTILWTLYQHVRFGTFRMLEFLQE